MEDGMTEAPTVRPDGLLLLDPADNILICVAYLARGTVVDIEGVAVALREAIEVGHKVARFALAAGDKVIRYGFPIGSMRAAAGVGDHIHQHNLASDYLPAHGRGAGQRGLDE